MDELTLFEESIKLEFNVRELYLLFCQKFPQDYDFWWELAIEENNHAALLRSGKDYFHPKNKFPDKLLYRNIETLKKQNGEIESLITSLAQKDISREEAFRLACKMEKQAGELHFQNFMDSKSDKSIEKVFKKLNSDDKSHSERIENEMRRLGIEEEKD